MSPSARAGEVLPTVDEVYQSALAEHQEFASFDQSEIFSLIGSTLGRIAMLEDVAHQPLQPSRSAADNIGTIWVHSGTGNYDQPFKPEDNPRLKVNPWMGGWDHARWSRAALLARKIAEARSGQSIAGGPISDRSVQLEETKQLIAEYGPTIVYSGYPAETTFAEKLLQRSGIIMPENKVKILHGDLKTTPDAIRTFEYPDDPAARQKEVAIISHAPHLGARTLHFIQHYQPLTEGSKPYMVPVATPEEGRKEFALMETRGLLYHAYITGLADKEPAPYQLLG